MYGNYPLNVGSWLSLACELIFRVFTKYTLVHSAIHAFAYGKATKRTMKQTQSKLMPRKMVLSK